MLLGQRYGCVSTLRSRPSWMRALPESPPEPAAPVAALPPPQADLVPRAARPGGGTSGAQRRLLEQKDRMVQTGADQIVQTFGLWGKGRRGLMMLVGQKRRRGARSCIRECRGWWHRGTTFALRSSSLPRGSTRMASACGLSPLSTTCVMGVGLADGACMEERGHGGRAPAARRSAHAGCWSGPSRSVRPRD